MTREARRVMGQLQREGATFVCERCGTRCRVQWRAVGVNPQDSRQWVALGVSSCPKCPEYSHVDALGSEYTPPEVVNEMVRDFMEFSGDPGARLTGTPLEYPDGAELH